MRRLPTLEALDVFNYKIIAVGFPLLTLGIIFGAVWAATAWGRPWGFDPKETWSAITWLIYAIYLHARYLAGWKGGGGRRCWRCWGLSGSSSRTWGSITCPCWPAACTATPACDLNNALH